MPLQQLIDRYLVAANDASYALTKKRTNLSSYAEREGAKEGYIKKETAEIQRFQEFMEAAKALVNKYSDESPLPLDNVPWIQQGREKEMKVQIRKLKAHIILMGGDPNSATWISEHEANTIIRQKIATRYV